MEGSLADVGLADICQLLAMGRKTGCLSVTDRSNFGYVYFEDGRITYASVLNRPDRLGELLVRNGVITRDTLSKAMEAQAHHPGKRLGRILVEMGALSNDTLREYVTIQIQEAVYLLFSWNRGSFHFDPDEVPDEDDLMLVSINPESLLLEGARRVDEWELIQQRISSMDLIFGLERDPAEEGEDVELTREQRTILPLVDGRRTVEDLVRESGLVEFDVAKALYGLVQAGFARHVGRGRQAPGDTDQEEKARHLNLGAALERAGMLEDAEREFRAVLRLDPMDPQALRRLAVLSLHSGRPQEALEHLDALPDGDAQTYATRRNRALALEELGRFEEALRELDQAEALGNGEDPEVALARAIVQLRSGDASSARATLAAYRSRAGAAPLSPMYYAYGTLAAAVDGAPDEAVEIGREGLRHHPGDGAILVNVAGVLERRGESEAAEALYLRAVSGGEPPAQAHKSLGDLAHRRGDRAGARAHYERAIQLQPDLGDDIYLKLGDIAYKEEDRERALELWRRALEINPGNEVVRTNLELLTTASGS